MDRMKLEEFRGQLRSQCTTLDMEKWERIPLPLNPGEGALVLFHRSQGRSDITATRVRMLRFSWTFQLDGSRATSALCSERRELANLGGRWLYCLSELELTD